MTPLLIPSFERRLLRTISDEVADKPVREWPSSSLQLGLEVVRKTRKDFAEARRALEEELANGVEARSFGRENQPLIPAIDEFVQTLRGLVAGLSHAEDPASKSLLAELRLVDQELKAGRDLLAEALARAAEPARPAEEERVRAAEEAYARGETKPFSRP
jgi:hypothetical protein